MPVEACEEGRLFPGFAHKAVYHGAAEACVGGVTDDLLVDSALLIGKDKELPVDVAEFLRQFVVGDVFKVAGREPFKLLPEEILQGRVVEVEGLLVDFGPCAQLLHGHVLVVGFEQHGRERLIYGSNCLFGHAGLRFRAGSWKKPPSRKAQGKSGRM